MSVSFTLRSCCFAGQGERGERAEGGGRGNRLQQKMNRAQPRSALRMRVSCPRWAPERGGGCRNSFNNSLPPNFSPLVPPLLSTPPRLLFLPPPLSSVHSIYSPPMTDRPPIPPTDRTTVLPLDHAMGGGDVTRRHKDAFRSRASEEGDFFLSCLLLSVPSSRRSLI